MEETESPRRARRRQRLEQLLQEFGGPAQVARESGTPKSHFSAMVARRRGLGDALAAKLEEIYGKPRGWFDEGEVAGTVLTAPFPRLAASGGTPVPSTKLLVLQLRELLQPHRASVRASAMALLGEMVDNIDNEPLAQTTAEDLDRLLGPALRP